MAVMAALPLAETARLESQWSVPPISRVAASEVAVVTVHVAAESVLDGSEPRCRQLGTRVRAERTPEWPDRTLGAHAGSTVRRCQRLGARRFRPRVGGANGCFAFARAHGLQGHGATEREADRARARGAWRLSRCVHIAGAHGISSASAR